MKILWFIPVCLPAISKRLGIPPNRGGWWIESLLTALLRNSDIELGVVWSSRDIHKAEHFVQDGVYYYCLPEGKRWMRGFGKVRRLLEIGGCDFTTALVDACLKVISDYQPDIIHIHGLEKPYGLIGERIDTPMILSIQGILTEYVKKYFGQLTFTQRITTPGLLYGYLNMRRRAMLERQVFRACRFFAGRTLWDKSHQADLNPFGRYFSCDELMRPEFYEARWSSSQTKKNTIYTTTSCLPYKGIDTLLDAVAILQRSFPDIRLRIGGNISKRGYGGFLRNKLKRLGIESAVEFLGWLPANRIVNELVHACVFVTPSFIENSPNSLAEAQLVGTPVVASNAGGIPSLVTDSETGLLFSPGDAAVLAKQCSKFLEDRDLASKCSKQSRIAAHNRHNSNKIIRSLLYAYGESIK